MVELISSFVEERTIRTYLKKVGGSSIENKRDNEDTNPFCLLTFDMVNALVLRLRHITVRRQYYQQKLPEASLPKA
jgi:hypothetical protein